MITKINYFTINYYRDRYDKNGDIHSILHRISLICHI